MQPMDKYENTLKQELMDACNNGKFSEFVGKLSNDTIRNEEKIRDKIVRNAILSGDTKTFDDVYKLFEDAGFENNGKQEFEKTVLRLQENEKFSAVAYALLSRNIDMVNQILLVVTQATGMQRNIVTENADKQVGKIIAKRVNIDKPYLNAPEDLGLDKADLTMINCFRGAEGLKGLDTISVRDDFMDNNLYKHIRENIPQVKIKMKELLEDGNYYLVEHNINKADRGQAKEWAKALRFADIDINKDDIKEKIKIPLSFIEADKAIASFSVRK